jgi:phosphatidylglycerol:prolipoprotein diacylglycerol transferase
MHAELLRIGSYSLHTYTVTLALSFALGIWLGAIRARRRQLDPGAVVDAGLWIALAVIPGARLYYLLLHPGRFYDDMLRRVMGLPTQEVWFGGLVMYGGFFGGLLAGLIFFRVRRAPFLPYADAMAPSLGLGVCLTRIGCFMTGCCYGVPHEGALSVSFPPSSPAGHYQQLTQSSGLFPSQLAESACGLIIVGVVLLAGRRKLFDGFQFYLACLLYAIFRFAIDFTRVYSPRERFGPLSHNQVVCIGLFAVCAALIVNGLRLARGPYRHRE